MTAIWDNRNAQVHGQNISDIERLEKLCSKCVILQNEQPAVGAADQHLLEIDLTDKKGMFLHHWKRALKVTVNRECACHKRQIREEMTAHLAQIRRRQQRQW